MKSILKFFFTAAFFVAFFSCKKDIATTSNNQVVSAENSNATSPVNTIGRQQVISLRTGDPTYKTSQSLLWVPHLYQQNNKTKTRFPLIINLYGQGQNGNDLSLMFQDNTMCSYIANGFNATAKNPVDKETYSFFVFSPQCPAAWGWSAPQVYTMLEELKEKFPIDTTRIYITGFSSGGWGLWSCITDNDNLTKQFAAIVPISSAAADHPDEITNVDKYGIACLSVCGDQDAFYTNAVNYTNIINENNPPIPAVLNTLKGVGHSAWVQAYDPKWKKNKGLNIYEWMLQYQRK